LPQEGQTVITIPKYIWQKVVEYYEKNEAQLRSMGIKSPTKLVQVWLIEKLSQG